MKKFIHVTYLMSILCTNAIAMEMISYQQATNQHIKPIVNVINTYAVNDNTKIVILPKKFRNQSIEQDIAKKRLYCATTPSDEIIAFKKLFIIDNEQEYNDITTNEIRCSGNNSSHVKTQAFNADNSHINTGSYKNFPISYKNSVLIYFGGDYTVPAYRNKKINSKLTYHAFDSIKNATIDSIKKNKIDTIVLFYGLTKANAGEIDNGIDRTPSIVRAFKYFVEQVTADSFNHSAKSDIIIHSQYEAFMPTFDPESTQCIPLPDNKAIAGYGNVLVFSLNNTVTQ